MRDSSPEIPSAAAHGSVDKSLYEHELMDGNPEVKKRVAEVSSNLATQSISLQDLIQKLRSTREEKKNFYHFSRAFLNLQKTHLGLGN